MVVLVTFRKSVSIVCVHALTNVEIYIKKREEKNTSCYWWSFGSVRRGWKHQKQYKYIIEFSSTNKMNVVNTIYKDIDEA